MQKLINYTDFFQFYIHIPIVLFDDLNDEEILRYCFEEQAYPIVIIRDNSHPLFIRISKEFKLEGVTEELKLIILAIGYNTPYLS